MPKIIDGSAMIQRVRELYEKGKVDLTYYNIVKEAVQMERELKAQEPRLVTKVDFENADAYGYLPVWVEYKDGEIICDCITITSITNLDVTCDYRFWTSKPSDEQRKAVKWE